MAALGRIQRGAHLHLAAFQAAGELLAQRWLGVAQLFGQAENEVQKTAVDRADFEAQPGCRSAAGAGALLDAGVASHAVN